MTKMTRNFHSGAFLEPYGNHKFKVLNLKLIYFHIFSIYYVQGCPGNFKRAKIVYINIEEDPEIRFLENIEQFKFSQTTLDIIFEKNGKLREIREFRVFVKIFSVEVHRIQRITGFIFL